jgi:type 1 fimbriae regulatory protein FimB/type 1 fimbriae regulatory protein FimE
MGAAQREVASTFVRLRPYALARRAMLQVLSRHWASAPAKQLCVLPYRSREHLTEREVERLVEAAKDNRWGHRDSTMVLLTFRHGLRASELVDLRWEQVDLENAILHVRRVKQGTPATHPLTGRELRALRRLQRETESKSPFVFVSERATPFSTRGFQAMVERAARAANFDMKIHPHMVPRAPDRARGREARFTVSVPRAPDRARGREAG